MSPAFSIDALFAALSRLAGDAARARYCVAFSGGVDSTALLQAMAGLCRSHPGMRLRALHINHRLQAQADAWSEHCQRVAERLGISCQALAVEVKTGPGVSTEAAAREARYAALRAELRQDELLLTAHHQNDQLETVLLQLLRGAGAAGLAAMPARANFGPGLHLRPLLEFTRADLEAWLRGVPGAAWIEDPSNSNPQYDRNYLRRHLLPPLLERWPSAAASVSRSAAHLAETQTLIEELARQDLAGAAQGAALSVDALRQLHPARARNLLRYWLRAAGVRPPSTVKLQEILRQMLEARPDSHPRVDWEGAAVHRRRGLIYLEPG